MREEDLNGPRELKDIALRSDNEREDETPEVCILHFTIHCVLWLLGITMPF